MRISALALSLSAALSFSSHVVYASPMFIGLGDLPGGDLESSARGVSADGSTVVGYSRSGAEYGAFLWTSGGGMIGLGDLPGGNFQGGANGISADGSVVVGQSYAAAGQEAFR